MVTLWEFTHRYKSYKSLNFPKVCLIHQCPQTPFSLHNLWNETQGLEKMQRGHEYICLSSFGVQGVLCKDPRTNQNSYFNVIVVVKGVSMSFSAYKQLT